jgi:hypothetical protein
MPSNQPADLAPFEQVQAMVKKAGFQLIIDKQDTAVVHQHQYAWDHHIYIDYWTVNTSGASNSSINAPQLRGRRSPFRPQRS